MRRVLVTHHGKREQFLSIYSFYQFTASSVEIKCADLTTASSEKKKELSMAAEAFLLNLKLDDLEAQIRVMEMDRGSDLPTAGE